MLVSTRSAAIRRGDDYISRKHGREPVVIPHPSTKPRCEGTYGVMLYQEQVMQIAQDMAGFTLGQADLLRRAMGKKKPEEMAKVREQFLDGWRRGSGSKDLRSTSSIDMEKFSGYAFNKSHQRNLRAGVVSDGLAEGHYPAEFMAANLSADMQNIDKVVTLVDEVRRMGWSLQPPSVNRSGSAFARRWRWCLSGWARRGVGEGPVAALRETVSRGPYRSLADLCRGSMQASSIDGCLKR